MLFLLSPAKTLDYGTPTADLPHHRPHFARQSAELMEVLREKTPAQLAGLMNISDSLASLNVARYQAWYAIEGRAATPRQLQGFAGEGYSFDPGASRADRMVFRRRMDQ